MPAPCFRVVFSRAEGDAAEMPFEPPSSEQDDDLAEPWPQPQGKLGIRYHRLHVRAGKSM